ncbi:amidohydrolase family protein [Paraburkholderia acidisoli]|uniref:Amidohydrolase family protein n=1 Tax=Paraburkholderia acidisoli TaxID=2571748 RepID=A0A7Z2GQI8_9BURK|nr:amidohydrolase family protein [Paraburkholderia acidisoli]QGZ66133.1 amidohydrolase family protein [Paraburkholderia acidisoli]
MTQIVDIHPHIISDDEGRYPPAPLFGKRSEWSKERPTTVETLIEAMDAAGIAKAAVVHSSTTYGFDNSYVVDGCAKYPHRLVAVGSVDVLQPDAPQTIRAWVKRGLVGLRLFTGGSTQAFDPSQLENPASFAAWEVCAELKLPMCITTGAVGLPQVKALAQRFPQVAIVLDHMTRPDLKDGAPYARAANFFELAALPNVYLKLTPKNGDDAKSGAATPETFFPKLIAEFGAQRLAWGSNYPTSPGTPGEIFQTMRDTLECVSAEDRAWIFGKTAQRLYPALA